MLLPYSPENPDRRGFRGRQLAASGDACFDPLLTRGGRHLRVAIASSGLGHVSRGVEVWASSLARALRGFGCDVRLFQGGGNAQEDWQKVLPCKHRSDPDVTRLVSRLKPFGGWRYGLGSAYEVEQSSFALSLWPRVRKAFDILHVQDPWVARILDRLNGIGLSRARVILAHGTEEVFDVLKNFSVLQHLAPCYLEQYRPHRPSGQLNFAVPNFVDTRRFRPSRSADARLAWGLPTDDLIVLCVAAIKKTHKRVDALIREFGYFQERVKAPATLVVAGAAETETADVIVLGRELLGSRVRFFESVPGDKMPSLFQAADLVAHASLHEMLPLAILEALASAVPVVCNDTPTLRWVVGPGGILANLPREGALSAAIEVLTDPGLRVKLGNAGRRHVEANFSESVVVRQILAMYHEVAPSAR